VSLLLDIYNSQDSNKRNQKGIETEVGFFFAAFDHPKLQLHYIKKANRSPLIPYMDFQTQLTLSQ